MVIPSLTDPSVAPPGKHVMSCFVQYAPYHLKEGRWDDHREAFGDTVVNTIAEYAPNIKDIILHRQVLTPLDIERTFGLSEGNIFQGELTLEQLFFLRPAPGWARYKTPVRNLHVRLGHTSRRRHHGRAGAERRDADSEGYVSRRKTEDGRGKTETEDARPHHHRRRPQRPRSRLLSRKGRASASDPRTSCHCRRLRDDGGV
jgi:hypothetical protein